MSDLDERERERVRALVERHKQAYPDGDAFFRDLYKAGMVDGWRALLLVGPDNKEKN